jgi:hypothetical protein
VRAQAKHSSVVNRGGAIRARLAVTVFLAAAIATLFATPASAAPLRNYEDSFATFTGIDPQALTVDQSSGDVYAVSAQGDAIHRFDASGAPKNFTAGPDAGTNTLTGLNLQGFPSFDQVAVDSSSGPSKGNIYATESGGGAVKVFANDGTPLGSLNGSGTPGGGLSEVCGVAVDQANGDVYVADWAERIWRYSPAASTAVEADYSGGIATTFNPCQLAVAAGSLYAHNWNESPVLGVGPLRKFATADFKTGPPPSPGSTVITSKSTAVATDPSSGDVYVDEGNKIVVFDSAGKALYTFGSSADFGTDSAGVAVKGAGGPAYVADRTGHQIDVFGPELEPGSRASLFSFATFTGIDPQALTVDQSSGDVYAVSAQGDAIHRFDASGAPKNFTAGPDAGTNTLTGLNLQGFPSFDQVAVDSSSGPSKGNIYATESGGGAVKVFANDGTPLGSLNGSGTPGGGLSEVCGVAVDQANGDVYVADWAERIWRYSPAASTAVEADYSGGIATTFNPCQLAVAAGSLYAHNWNESPVLGVGPLRKFATADFKTGPPPSPGSTVITSKSTAVATDPSSGDVYVDEGNKIVVFDSAGKALYTFGSSADFGTDSAGVAVKGAGGPAYVADRTGHQIDVFGPFSPPVIPPVVTTRAASNVKNVKATLNGKLDPNGGPDITDCRFEWGTTITYGNAAACSEGISFSAPADVSAVLSGLTPGETYHFRLTVITGAGEFSGDDQSFEAIPASPTPVATTGKGTALSATSATLEGTVNPSANPLTDCRFEYVDDIAFQATGFADLSSGGSEPCTPAFGTIPVDFEDNQVTATVSGLDPEQFYRFRLVAENANGVGNGDSALIPGPPLVETTGSPTRTATTARLDSRVIAHGAPTTYHFEYVTDEEFQDSGFTNAQNTPDKPISADEHQQILVMASSGQFRLTFGDSTTVDLAFDATAAKVQGALRALPSIEPSNVTVRLLKNPFSNYIVRFTGSLADTNVPQLTVSNGTIPLGGSATVETPFPGGPDNQVSLVSAHLQGLDSDTTYRYRVVADNGNPDGSSFGEDVALTTRADDTTLDHGDYPGPPGSDRAWEQVNVPDTGGNTVSDATALSSNGDRAVYTLRGGDPGSETGSLFNQLFAERTPSGWQARRIFPRRDQAIGNVWIAPAGREDLSEFVTANSTTVSDPAFKGTTWRLSPDGPPQLLSSLPISRGGAPIAVSDDASRVVTAITDTTVGPNPNLYDISDGTADLIGLLPDGSVPACGLAAGEFGFLAVPTVRRRDPHWISADGDLVFFPSNGNGPCDLNSDFDTRLYVRDVNGGVTDKLSPPPASGPSCSEMFMRSTSEAAFFWTKSALTGDDTAPNSCAERGVDGDVYRYDIATKTIKCVTCVVSGLDADVIITNASFGGADEEIAVSSDGSRIYFRSSSRLLPGAATPGIYRLAVATGNLAYVAPGVGVTIAVRASNNVSRGNAVTPDGTVFVFRSDFPALDAQNGPGNAGTAQYYRYDDSDRSLVCISCPLGGGPPRGGVDPSLLAQGQQQLGPNIQPLSEDGDLAFATPTPLVSADQNTAGTGEEVFVGADIYEWRDGRLLLVTDGLSASKGTPGGGNTPVVAGVTPSGRDIFFLQSAQLTLDALDAYKRLYNARIGGGFEFPSPPPLCPLEVCQGTPKGAPEEAAPGTHVFSGPGNVQDAPPRKRCGKGKRRVRRAGQVRCVKRHQQNRQRRANRNRRIAR